MNVLLETLVIDQTWLTMSQEEKHESILSYADFDSMVFLAMLNSTNLRKHLKKCNKEYITKKEERIKKDQEFITKKEERINTKKDNNNFTKARIKTKKLLKNNCTKARIKKNYNNNYNKNFTADYFYKKDEQDRIRNHGYKYINLKKDSIDSVDSDTIILTLIPQSDKKVSIDFDWDCLTIELIVKIMQWIEFKSLYVKLGSVNKQWCKVMCISLIRYKWSALSLSCYLTEFEETDWREDRLDTIKATNKLNQVKCIEFGGLDGKLKIQPVLDRVVWCSYVSKIVLRNIHWKHCVQFISILPHFKKLKSLVLSDIKFTGRKENDGLEAQKAFVGIDFSEMKIFDKRLHGSSHCNDFKLSLVLSSDSVMWCQKHCKWIQHFENLHVVWDKDTVFNFQKVISCQMKKMALKDLCLTLINPLTTHIFFNEVFNQLVSSIIYIQLHSVCINFFVEEELMTDQVNHFLHLWLGCNYLVLNIDLRGRDVYLDVTSKVTRMMMRIRWTKLIQIVSDFIGMCLDFRFEDKCLEITIKGQSAQLSEIEDCFHATFQKYCGNIVLDSSSKSVMLQWCPCGCLNNEKMYSRIGVESCDACDIECYGANTPPEKFDGWICWKCKLGRYCKRICS